MSEDFGTNSKLDLPSTQAVHPPLTALVEHHAVQLMDELFQDLDTETDPFGDSLPSATPAHRSDATTSLALAVQDALPDSLLIPYVEMDAILDPFPESAPLHAPIQSSEPGLGSTLLLGLAWGSFLAAAGLWAFTQFNKPATVAAPAAAPAVAAASPQDVAFAESLLQTLQETETASTSTPNTVTATLPTVSSTLPIAVPQQNSAGRSPFQSIAPAPNAPATQSAALPQKTVAAPRPSVNVPPKAPPTVALSTLPNDRLPKLSSAPSTLPASQMPSLAPQQPLPMERQSQSGIMVQGVLDLGEKSAILISRNGSPQNIRLGEVVDATGWVFSRVENGQAILQRGTETRSVSSGEQF